MSWKKKAELTCDRCGMKVLVDGDGDEACWPGGWSAARFYYRNEKTAGDKLYDLCLTCSEVFKNALASRDHVGRPVRPASTAALLSSAGCAHGNVSRSQTCYCPEDCICKTRLDGVCLIDAGRIDR